MLKWLFILSQIFAPFCLSAQVSDSLKFIHKIPCLNNQISDTLIDDHHLCISASTINDSLYLTFINKSSVCIFLFSSYFESKFIKNPYLTRIVKGGGKIKVSFVPLRPSTILSDRIILRDDQVLIPNQILYDFIEIKPMCHFTLSINANDLISSLKDRKFFIKDFDVKKITQDFRLRKTKSQNLSHKEVLTLFEFAYYNNLDFLFKSIDSMDSYVKSKENFMIINYSWKTIKLSQ